MCAQCATTERQAQRPTVGNTERTFFDKSVRSSTVLRKSLGDGKTKKEHYLQNSIKKNPKNQKAKQKKPLLLGVVKKNLELLPRIKSKPNCQHCLLGSSLPMAAKQGMPRLGRELKCSQAMGGNVPELEAAARDWCAEGVLRVSPSVPSSTVFPSSGITAELTPNKGDLRE